MDIVAAGMSIVAAGYFNFFALFSFDLERLACLIPTPWAGLKQAKIGFSRVTHVGASRPANLRLFFWAYGISADRWYCAA